MAGTLVAPLETPAAATYRLRNARSGAILASAIEPAFSRAARRKGLLGRDHLPEGAALVLAPCSSIHTFFMRFRIDVVFVARDGRVLKACAAVPPGRIRLAWGAHAAIELPAGAIARSGTRRGDRLELVAGC